MFQMSVITSQTLFYFISSDLALAILLLEFLQPAFESPLVARTKSPDHLAGICQVEMPSQIIHTLTDGKHLCFLIEFQFQHIRRICSDLIQTLLQILLSSWIKTRSSMYLV